LSYHEDHNVSITYQQAHRRLGRAAENTCPCGTPAREWAYQHTAAEPLIEDGRPYSLDPADYVAMCHSCHVLLDHQHQPKWRESLQAHMRVLGSQPKSFAQTSAAGKLGIVAAAPKLVEHRQAIAALNHTAKRRCLGCGMVSVRTGLGRHQQVSGHTGWEDVA